MRDENILPALKQERAYKTFCAGAESFLRRWSPEDPRESFEFTAELMGLFREMIISHGIIHQEVATKYFEQTMRTATAYVVAPPIPEKK